MKKIKVVLLLAGLLVFSGAYSAEDIAQCSNPSGKGYFPYLGVVPKNSAGWNDEMITGGITTLTKLGKDEYDILFVDSSKRIISSKQDGGKVLLLYKGEKELSVLVVYIQVVEAYNFFINNDGKAEYTDVISRAGDGAMISKASVMRGDCQFVRLDLVN